MAKVKLNEYKVDQLMAQIRNESDPYKKDNLIAMLRDEYRQAGFQLKSTSEDIVMLAIPERQAEVAQIEAPKTVDKVPETSPAESQPQSAESATELATQEHSQAQSADQADKAEVEKTEETSQSPIEENKEAA